MKKQLLKITGIMLVLSVITLSCEKTPGPDIGEDSILPEKFSVEIPDALTYSAPGLKSAQEVQPVNGNLIYLHLATFIKVGEAGGEIVSDIIKGIVRYNINRPLSLTIESEEDGRMKNITVIRNSDFGGETWEYQLTMSDMLSEGNADKGIGMQIFWNRAPRKGISVIKPYNINRSDTEMAPEAIFRIDYSEAGERGYDAHMVVAATGLPVLDPLEDAFSLKTLKMFVGRKGNKVDVYGNSDHPNARFFTNDTGFNWAFAASGDDDLNIAVAEVGIPRSSLDDPARSVILGTNSIRNVFTSQIYTVWPNIDPESVSTFLLNTTAPGFFGQRGFIQGGTAPNASYDVLVARIASLTPYNPKEIAELSLGFKLN